MHVVLELRNLEHHDPGTIRHGDLMQLERHRRVAIPTQRGGHQVEVRPLRQLHVVQPRLHRRDLVVRDTEDYQATVAQVSHRHRRPGDLRYEPAVVAQRPWALELHPAQFVVTRKQRLKLADGDHAATLGAFGDHQPT
jgi:hypothetical protein